MQKNICMEGVGEGVRNHGCRKIFAWRGWGKEYVTMDAEKYLHVGGGGGGGGST